MAKLPLITVVATETGPTKVTTIPKTTGGDSKGYYDTETGKIVVDKLVIDSLDAGILKTDVDGNVSANATIGHAEVEGLGGLALVDAVDLADGEVTGTLPVEKGGTGKSSITAGALLLGAGTEDMTELVGTENDQVVKWNSSTSTWYAGTGGGGGGGAVDSVSVTAPITNTGTATDPIIGIDQTAIGIAASQVSGLAAVATSGSASDISTGTLAKDHQAAQDMGGDVSGTTAAATVAKIQGRTISTAAPADGQTLVWSSGSSQWVPGGNVSGGSGGGGVTYYMNFGDTDNITPTTNIPTNSTSTPNAPPYQLGRTSVGSTAAVTSAELGTVNMEHICSFVTVSTPSTDPNITNIPAGLWDFNIWARQISTQGGHGSALQSSFEIRVYKYSSGSVRTLLQSSDIIYIYDPTVVAQYIAQVNFPQTTILASDRIVVEIWGKAAVQNRAIEFSFNGNTASHCHTTIPSVSGTGLVKVVDGSYQTPASYLVDADVDANAAIARTKLAASVSGDRGKLLMNDASSGAIVAAAYASLAQGGLGTGSNTGASGKILVGNGSSSFAEQTMGGDATIAADGTLTLATLSPSVPTDQKGSATKVAKVTLNAKGLVTALSEEAIILTSAGLPAEVVYTNTSQTISGNKTFSGEVTLSALTASRVLKLDSNGKVAADYIRDADVATDAAIARDKLAAGTAFNALVVNDGTTKKLSELAISTTAGHVLKSNGTSAGWDSIASLLPANVALLDAVSQIFTQKVTFSASTAPIALTGLTASLPLKLDSSGNVKSEAIALGGSEVSGVLAADKGGTGFGTGNTYAIGDILYASAATTLSKLAAVATGNVLISGGETTAPSWGKVGLTTHVSGTLGFSHGGVGADISSTGATYGVVYKASGTAVSVTGAGSANTFLKSGAGSEAPSFTALTATDIAGITPYDISGEAVGSVSVSDVVMRFFASRDCTVKVGTYTGASCVTAPSGASATFNIKKSGGGTAIGTITFTSGSNTGTISIASDVPLTGGTDYLTVECTAANGIATPWFTIKGTA